jgi:hypothetical protein
LDPSPPTDASGRRTAGEGGNSTFRSGRTTRLGDAARAGRWYSCSTLNTHGLGHHIRGMMALRRLGFMAPATGLVNDGPRPPRIDGGSDGRRGDGGAGCRHNEVPHSRWELRALRGRASARPNFPCHIGRGGGATASAAFKGFSRVLARGEAGAGGAGFRLAQAGGDA